MNVPTSAYGRLCTEVYDLGDQDSRQHILDFYLRHWEGTRGPVLEAMCGTGYFLIPFMERGADIDGVDASPHMLKALRQKCDARALNPALYTQIIQQLDLPRKYGYVLIPDRSFALLNDIETAREGLQRLLDHLLPGGKLVLDVKSPPFEREETGVWKVSRYERPDGSVIVWNRLLQSYEQGGRVWRWASRYELVVDGKLQETELGEYVERFYEEGEFVELLERVGFEQISVTKAYSDAQPLAGDDLVFMCRKPG